MGVMGPYSFYGLQALIFLSSEKTVAGNLAMIIRNLQVLREAPQVDHVALRTAKVSAKGRKLLLDICGRVPGR